MNATAMPVNRPNRHIVDQLADVRDQIKELEERESDLKSQVKEAMGARASLAGSDYIASLSISERAGALDAAKLEKALGSLAGYRKAPTRVETLRLERREA